MNHTTGALQTIVINKEFIQTGKEGETGAWVTFYIYKNWIDCTDLSLKRAPG